jgi:NADH-quinone oxidoreductase E subunit
MLSEKNIKKLDDLKKFYPTKQALVLPVLWMIQEERGHISEEAMRYVGELLDVPFGHVLGVVTFYTMFRDKPQGKHHVEVCTNVSCMLKGSARIVEHLEKRLGLKLGETSEDMKWTLSEAECMGSCGTAPMIAVGEEYYENLTTEQVDELLANLERK